MPLWAQLHDDLSRRLAVGAFEETFPGELELVEEYAVSRHTVREALRRLRDRGILDTTRGRATQIRRNFEQPLGTLYSMFREVESAGLSQTSVVLDQSLVTSPAVALRLDLPEDAELFHLERIRLADGVPLAHDRVWLPADQTGNLVEADFTRTALYDELARRCGITLSDGTEQISAVLPDQRERGLLGLSEGVACLRIERLGRRAGRAIELRDTLVRGDRYRVSTTWSSVPRAPIGKTSD